MKIFSKGFVYAFRGIRYCLRNERNMRFHLSISIYMYFFIFAFDFFEVSRTQLAVLMCISAAVMAAEVFNTAIESTVNLVTEKYAKAAEIAKDAAAGAVLVLAIFSVFIGIAILWQPQAFSALFAYIKTHMLFIPLLIAALSASFAYIILGPQKIINIFKKDKN